MTTTVCPSCNEPDNGAEFCLSCQQPMPRDLPEVHGMIEVKDIELSPVAKAGFFRRFAAFALDWLILSIIADIVRFAYRFGSGTDPGITNIDAAMGLSAALFILYFVLFTGEGGQTLGKMLLGIRVQSLDGSPVGYRLALVRTLGYVLSTFFMTFLGFLWALWDKEKQAWHDKIARTIVVRI